MLTIPLGKPLPLHPTYTDDSVARQFWRLSFHTGRRYVDGADAKGNKVLPPHEREREGYARRKQLTKPRNHAGPIIRRYNDHVVRRKATRVVDGADPVYQLLVEDADAKGTSIVEFFKRALLTAQIERESYIMPDSTAPASGEALTLAQAQAQGVRPYLRRLGADAIPWWRDHDGALVECIVLLVDDEGVEFGRCYDARTYRDIEFKLAADGVQEAGRVVESVSAPIAHPYGGCPIVRLRPLFSDDGICGDSGESQISPLAELQQSITWHLSLLTEEIANVCFSQIVATGVSADQVKDVPIGNNRVICLPNAAGSWDVIGADPAQAASISTRIADDERELYRIAGIDAGSSTDGAGAPESGLAKAFKHNDLAANLAALALGTQEAENLAMRRVFTALGKTPPAPAAYPREFDLPALADELNEVIRGATCSQLPVVLRRKLVERFASRNFELSPEDAKELATELESLEPLAANDPPAGRMPGT